MNGHRHVDRGDLGAGARRHERDQAEMVDVLMGDDHELDVLERVAEPGDAALQLVEARCRSSDRRRPASAARPRSGRRSRARRRTASGWRAGGCRPRRPGRTGRRTRAETLLTGRSRTGRPSAQGPGVHLRLLAAFALIGALAAGAFAASRERDYRAHAYVIRVPAGLRRRRRAWRFARSDRVLRARARAGRRSTARSPAWLRRHSTRRAHRPGRLRVHRRLRPTRDGGHRARHRLREGAQALARAPSRGCRHPGRGARARRGRPLGPLGWALLGGAAGLWLGAAVAIVRSGSARAPRRASRSMCSRETSDSRLSRSSGSVFDGPHVEVPVVVVDRDAVEVGRARRPSSARRSPPSWRPGPRPRS